MVVGAGTLLEPDQVKQAADCGARFGLAPGLDPHIVGVASDIEFDFIPGVAIPSEVQAAFKLGCKVQKIFPAEQLGGVDYIKALEGPYAHLGVKFIPTGGLNAANVASYLALKSVMAAGGSWFVDKKYINSNDWSTITKLTQEALIQVKNEKN